MASDRPGDSIVTVVTCEGNFSDPQFPYKLSSLVARLKRLLQTGDKPFSVTNVEPWNSVRVTFNIPREAAQRLRQLAQAGDRVLRDLGILSVQIEGDQVISLTIAGQFNEPQEIILQTSDVASSSSSSTHLLPFNLPVDGSRSSTSSNADGGGGIKAMETSSSSSPLQAATGSAASVTSQDSITSPFLVASVDFKSPNVVAPKNEPIPFPPKITSLANNSSSSASSCLGSLTPNASRTQTPFGPFPFASMTHAMNTMHGSSQLMQTPYQKFSSPFPTSPPYPPPSPSSSSSSSTSSSSSSSSCGSGIPITPPPPSLGAVVPGAGGGISSGKGAFQSVKPPTFTSVQSAANHHVARGGLGVGMVDRANAPALTSPLLVNLLQSDNPPTSSGSNTTTTQGTVVVAVAGMMSGGASKGEANKRKRKGRKLLKEETITVSSSDANSAATQRATAGSSPRPLSNNNNNSGNANSINLELNSSTTTAMTLFSHLAPLSPSPPISTLTPPSASPPTLLVDSKPSSFNTTTTTNHQPLIPTLPSPPPTAPSSSNSSSSSSSATLSSSRNNNNSGQSSLEVEHELSPWPSPSKRTQHLINPFTGQLEPMSSDDDVDEVNLNNSGGSSSSAVTVSAVKDERMMRLGSGSSDSSQHHSHLTKDEHAPRTPRAVTCVSPGASAERESGSGSPSEKIKLRLKLDQKQEAVVAALTPTNLQYKVDVSFVNIPTRRLSSAGMSGSGAGAAAEQVVVAATSPTGSTSPCAAEPRVPPLHISLRGRNAAVVTSPRKEEKDWCGGVSRTSTATVSVVATSTTTVASVTLGGLDITAAKVQRSRTARMSKEQLTVVNKGATAMTTSTQLTGRRLSLSRGGGHSRRNRTSGAGRYSPPCESTTPVSSSSNCQQSLTDSSPSSHQQQQTREKALLSGGSVSVVEPSSQPQLLIGKNPATLVSGVHLPKMNSSESTVPSAAERSTSPLPVQRVSSDSRTSPNRVQDHSMQSPGTTTGSVHSVVTRLSAAGENAERFARETMTSSSNETPSKKLSSVVEVTTDEVKVKPNSVALDQPPTLEPPERRLEQSNASQSLELTTPDVKVVKDETRQVSSEEIATPSTETKELAESTEVTTTNQIPVSVAPTTNPREALTICEETESKELTVATTTKDETRQHLSPKTAAEVPTPIEQSKITTTFEESRTKSQVEKDDEEVRLSNEVTASVTILVPRQEIDIQNDDSKTLLTVSGADQAKVGEVEERLSSRGGDEEIVEVSRRSLSVEEEEMLENAVRMSAQKEAEVLRDSVLMNRTNAAFNKESLILSTTQPKDVIVPSVQMALSSSLPTPTTLISSTTRMEIGAASAPFLNPHQGKLRVASVALTSCMVAADGRTTTTVLMERLNEDDGEDDVVHEERLHHHHHILSASANTVLTSINNDSPCSASSSSGSSPDSLLTNTGGEESSGDQGSGSSSSSSGDQSEGKGNEHQGKNHPTMQRRNYRNTGSPYEDSGVESMDATTNIGNESPNENYGNSNNSDKLESNVIETNKKSSQVDERTNETSSDVALDFSLVKNNKEEEREEKIPQKTISDETVPVIEEADEEQQAEEDGDEESSPGGNNKEKETEIVEKPETSTTNTSEDSKEKEQVVEKERVDSEKIENEVEKEVLNSSEITKLTTEESFEKFEVKIKVDEFRLNEVLAEVPAEIFAEPEMIKEVETAAEPEIVKEPETVKEPEILTDAETVRKPEIVREDETAVNEAETVKEPETVREPESIIESKTRKEDESEVVPSSPPLLSFPLDLSCATREEKEEKAFENETETLVHPEEEKENVVEKEKEEGQEEATRVFLEGHSINGQGGLLASVMFGEQVMEDDDELGECGSPSEENTTTQLLVFTVEDGESIVVTEDSEHHMSLLRLTQTDEDENNHTSTLHFSTLEEGEESDVPGISMRLAIDETDEEKENTDQAPAQDEKDETASDGVDKEEQSGTENETPSETAAEPEPGASKAPKELAPSLAAFSLPQISPVLNCGAEDSDLSSRSLSLPIKFVALPPMLQRVNAAASLAGGGAGLLTSDSVQRLTENTLVSDALKMALLSRNSEDQSEANVTPPLLHHLFRHHATAPPPPPPPPQSPPKLRHNDSSIVYSPLAGTSSTVQVEPEAAGEFHPTSVRRKLGYEDSDSDSSSTSSMSNDLSADHYQRERLEEDDDDEGEDDEDDEDEGVNSSVTSGDHNYIFRASSQPKRFVRSRGKTVAVIEEAPPITTTNATETNHSSSSSSSSSESSTRDQEEEEDPDDEEEEDGEEVSERANGDVNENRLSVEIPCDGAETERRTLRNTRSNSQLLLSSHSPGKSSLVQSSPETERVGATAVEGGGMEKEAEPKPTAKRKRGEESESEDGFDGNHVYTKPVKRKCSENAVELIKACIGVEDVSAKKTANAKQQTTGGAVGVVAQDGRMNRVVKAKDDIAAAKTKVSQYSTVTESEGSSDDEVTLSELVTKTRAVKSKQEYVGRNATRNAKQKVKSQSSATGVGGGGGMLDDELSRLNQAVGGVGRGKNGRAVSRKESRKEAKEGGSRGANRTAARGQDKSGGGGNNKKLKEQNEVSSSPSLVAPTLPAQTSAQKPSSDEVVAVGKRKLRSSGTSGYYNNTLPPKRRRFSRDNR